MVSVRQGGYPERDRGAEEGLGQGYYEVRIFPPSIMSVSDVAVHI